MLSLFPFALLSLPLIPDPSSISSMQVTVTTGDCRGAGTDGKVEVKLGSTAGQSDWLELSGDFQRGSVDKASLRAIAMAEERTLTVRIVSPCTLPARCLQPLVPAIPKHSCVL